MINAAFTQLKTKKLILQGLLFFVTFIVLYSMIDSLNLSYGAMAMTYGVGLVVLNIGLNLLMAFGSALMLNLSTVMLN
jgi:hypothetical protein